MALRTKKRPLGAKMAPEPPYPIFLRKSQKPLTALKNRQKPHFNPLRIENLSAQGHSSRIF
jgi:hypothetical protein